MQIATIVFALLALTSFVAYQISVKLTGAAASKVAYISWDWAMPISFIAAACSSAFS